MAKPAKSLTEDQLAWIADLNTAFSESLDIESTLRFAMYQIQEFLKAEAASIFMVTPDGERLRCFASSGPVSITGLQIGIHDGIVGKAVRTGQVQIVEDVKADKDFAGFIDEKTGFETHSILCAPLIVQDRKFGAIELINKTTGTGLFGHEDHDFLRTLASSASLAIHNAEMTKILLDQERLRHELELASQIQKSFLPVPNTDAFPIHAINLPVGEVSGDFYDYFAVSDDVLLFNIADVSGKGMNAALLMAKTSSLFHCLGKVIHDPAELLDSLNRELCENITHGMFVTMIAGLFDRKTKKIYITNAGHLPAIHIDQDSVKEYGATSPPLGIFPDTVFEKTEIDLSSGALYCYTDGITEARLTNHAPLDVDGLLYLIRLDSRVSKKRRLDSITKRMIKNVDKLSDDITMLLIDPS